MSAQERWLPGRDGSNVMAQQHTVVCRDSGADGDDALRDSDDAEVLTSVHAHAHARRQRNERATRKELEEPWRS